MSIACKPELRDLNEFNLKGKTRALDGIKLLADISKRSTTEMK